MQSSRISITLAAIALCGACAPEEHPTAPTSAELPFHAGNLNGATIGRVGPAQTTTSAGVTLTGLVGKFTRLSVNDPSETPGGVFAYFSARDTLGAFRIWRVRTNRTGLRQLTSDGVGQIEPAVSNAGDHLVFAQLDTFASNDIEITDLWLWTPAGGPQFLAHEINLLANPVWIPGDTSIIYASFFQTNRGLLRRNVETAAVDTLTHALDGLTTTAMINGVPTAIFERGDALFRMDLTNLAATPYFDSDFRVYAPQISPDGRRILFYQAGPCQLCRSLRLAPLDHPESSREVTFFDVGMFPDDARWLPDGSGLVIVADDSVRDGQLFLMDTMGVRHGQLTLMPHGVFGNISVGPSVSGVPRVLLGDEGPLGSSASGIIFGQGQGGQATAVVAFGASRQRSVTLKAETGLNATAPVLTFTLSADQLTSLAFVSGPIDGPVITVVDSTTAAVGGALITFDAVTGGVALILPFATAAGSTAQVIDVGGSRVFRGDFLGVWQGKVNLAPLGAREVELQTASRKVTVNER